MAYSYRREGESHRDRPPVAPNRSNNYDSHRMPLRTDDGDQPPPYWSVGQNDQPQKPPAYAPTYTGAPSYVPQAQYTSHRTHDVEIEMSESVEHEIYEHQPFRYQHDKNKKEFLRKVYLLLLSQLMLTGFVSGICMFVDFVRNYCLQNLWLFWVGIVLSFVLLIAMYCVHNKYPTNLYLLFAWTLVESYTIGVICALYVSVGYQDAVLQAFLLTVVITVSLTIFTIQSNINFSFLRGFLFAMLWVLIAWGIINIIFGFQLQFIYSLIGAIVFSLFIVYDTYRIWKSNEFDCEYGYIDASISLYLDIINLFLFLLSLFSSSDN